MNSALCILNMGNTHVTVWHPEPDSRKVLSIHEFTEQDIPDGCPCAAACVVPAWNPVLDRHGVFRLTPDSCGLDLSQMSAATVGADRLANIYSLLNTGSLPAMSIDFGTAIDAEIVDEQQRMTGGAILPGRTLLRLALHEHTAALPMIPLEGPDAPFPANNTADALRYGTDTAIADAVSAMIERARACFPGRQLRVMACGGDRAWFLKRISGMTDGGDRFTLQGILYAYQRNHRS